MLFHKEIQFYKKRLQDGEEFVLLEQNSGTDVEEGTTGVHHVQAEVAEETEETSEMVSVNTKPILSPIRFSDGGRV